MYLVEKEYQKILDIINNLQEEYQNNYYIYTAKALAEYHTKNYVLALTSVDNVLKFDP